MSFFQNRSDFGAPDDHDPDVVHLSSHGCDVRFSHYDGGTQGGPCANSLPSRSLIIQGKLTLAVGGHNRILSTGEWFEIPPRTEYSIHFHTDCSLIEFSFDPDKP